MGFFLTQFLHGDLQSPRHVGPLNVTLVEMTHQLGGALIMNVPQREQQSGRPGAEQAALKAQQLVAGGHKVHAGGAATQSDQPSVQLHLVEVIQIEVSIAQTDARKHGVILAIHPCVAMCRIPLSWPFSRSKEEVACSPRWSDECGNSEFTQRTSSRISGARSSAMPSTSEAGAGLAAFC